MNTLKSKYDAIQRKEKILQALKEKSVEIKAIQYK